MIELIFPDGTANSFPVGTTGSAVAESIGPRLAAAAVVVKLDGELRDLARPLESGGHFEVVTAATEEGRAVLRHSAAHVLAQAVLDLYEGALFAIGPAITDGFYYDFDVGSPFSPEDLERIQQRMQEIIAADQPFVRDEVSREVALDLFADQPFKSEIIAAAEPSEVDASEEITLYRNDGFVDLCRGPHVPSTGRLKAVRLTRSSGAYWRGSEHNPQLQRIYGTAWEDGAALDAYMTRLEEAERRDHRRIGPELDLFSFPSELGPGLAVWHPKGGLMRLQIEDYSRRTHLGHGYEIVATPHVARSVLWETSGHLQFFRDGMYPAMEMDGGQEYFVKPMNCPFHILIYKSRSRSYRELPLRLFELGTVYRNERSGSLHGLLRVRGLTMDDSHIFCHEDQLAGELQNLLDFVLMVLRDFGFEDFEADLSTKPGEDHVVGPADLWDKATDALREALETASMPYGIAEGEGAFYGPKIDIHVRDAIGRRWQLSTIQVDFAQPINFDLEYATSSNTRERPVMIHRALLGAVERFTGLLIEHYAGSLPGWLSPVQVSVVPVADRHNDYGHQTAETARSAGLRAEVDTSDDTVGEKIRRAITQHHPAILVVGDDDVAADSVGLRLRGEERDRRGVAVADAVAEITELCKPPR